MVEQRTHKPRVGGSNPSTATNSNNNPSRMVQKTRKERSGKQREMEKHGAASGIQEIPGIQPHNPISKQYL